MSFGVIPGAVAVYAGQLVAIEQREGTGHVIFEPLDFSARLAGLVPSPAVNLTRYHGVFAPNHRLTALIVPAQRGRDGSSGQGQGRAGQGSAEARRDALGAAASNASSGSRSTPASIAAERSRSSPASKILKSSVEFSSICSAGNAPGDYQSTPPNFPKQPDRPRFYLLRGR